MQNTAAMYLNLLCAHLPRQHREQGIRPHPRQAVDDSAPIVLHKLLAHGQLLLVALINLNPVQRVHGLQPHRHLVFALHKT